MGDARSDAFEIDAPEGRIHGRQWIPAHLVSTIPIILLHDSLGSVDLWRDFPQRLSDSLARSVIAYDRLGFGKSGQRTGVPSPGFIEEEATTYFPLVKKQLSLTAYILFGHSVGGAMSINIAARDAACAAVITESSQAFVEDRTIAGITAAKQAFEQAGQIERLRKWHGDKAQWVLQAWTDVWLSAEFADWSLAESIGNVTCPVLAIHGDRDEYGSRAFPEFIAGRAGGVSELMMLHDCGHMPHKERPQAVIEAVRTFLTKHVANRGDGQETACRTGGCG